MNQIRLPPLVMILRELLEDTTVRLIGANGEFTASEKCADRIRT